MPGWGTGAKYQGYLTMPTIKALIPGAAITMLVSAMLYGAGTRNGVFALQQASLLELDIYWSCPAVPADLRPVARVAVHDRRVMRQSSSASRMTAMPASR